MNHSHNKPLTKPLIATTLMVSALMLVGCKSLPGLPQNVADKSHLTLYFDGNGRLKVTDVDGKLVHEKRNDDEVVYFKNYADAQKEITDAKANRNNKKFLGEFEITITEIQGSHYYIYCLKRSCYKIPLPH